MQGCSDAPCTEARAGMVMRREQRLCPVQVLAEERDLTRKRRLGGESLDGVVVRRAPRQSSESRSREGRPGGGVQNDPGASLISHRCSRVSRLAAPPYLTDRTV